MHTGMNVFENACYIVSVYVLLMMCVMNARVRVCECLRVRACMCVTMRVMRVFAYARLSG